MPTKLIETTWADFSAAFAKFHKLPFGTELRLFDSSGRKKRTDFKVKRNRISSSSMTRADEDDNVRALIDAAVSLLSTDLHSRRLKVELFGPDGQSINGNTLIRKVRKMEPKLSAADLERRREEEAFVAEVQTTAYASIVESEHLVDDPSTTVCGAYIQALVERYGRRAVVSALGR